MTTFASRHIGPDPAEQTQMLKADNGATMETGLEETPAGWVHVRDINGGYGTTGQEVVAALPLAAIGADHGGRLADVRAFSALMPASAGSIADRVDEVTL